MFSELVKPIKKAILFAYDLKRKNENKNIPYKGYNIGEKSLVTCFSPVETLRVKNLKYSLEDQGRDALDEIIAIAIQLGIEQGYRIFKDSTEYKLIQLRLSLRKT